MFSKIVVCFHGRIHFPLWARPFASNQKQERRVRSPPSSSSASVSSTSPSARDPLLQGRLSKTPVETLAKFKHQKDGAGTMALLQLAIRDPNFDIRSLNRFLRNIVRLERYKDVRQVRKVIRKLDLRPTLLTFGLFARAYGALNNTVQLDALWEDFQSYLRAPHVPYGPGSLNSNLNILTNKQEKGSKLDPNLNSNDSHLQRSLMEEFPQQMARTVLLNTFAAIIEAFGKCRNVEACEKVIAYMKERKVRPSVIVLERLMGAYGAAGRYDKVDETFNKIKSMRNVRGSNLVIPFTTALKLNAMAGKFDVVVQLQKDIKELKVPLDAGWYNALIHAYSRRGPSSGAGNEQKIEEVISEVEQIIAEMKSNQIDQDRNSRDALLAALGRLGCIERAPELITWRCPEHYIAPTISIPAVEICYEDEHLIVVNKPPLLPTTQVYPLNNERPSLLDVVWAHCGGKLSRLSPAPGMVHRLDRDTSGAVIFAKTDQAYATLQYYFESRQIRKEYLAFVHKVPETLTGVVDRPIARVELRRGPGVSCSVNDSLGQPVGKESVTQFRILKQFAEKYALLLCVPVTGRTHQIRVHLAYIKHPVLGDRLYGRGPNTRDSLNIPRIMLHCYSLTFKHPVTGKPLEVRAPLPEDFKKSQCSFK